MVPNNNREKPDCTRCSLALHAIACTLISIGALTILIDLMWLAIIFLALGSGYYGLRAQTPDLNRLAYRLRLLIYKML
jgi:hypothetical protein